MAAQMTKAQLIEKIAAENEMGKKDVKGVLETLATIGYKELKKELIISASKARRSGRSTRTVQATLRGQAERAYQTADFRDPASAATSSRPRARRG